MSSENQNQEIDVIDIGKGISKLIYKVAQVIVDLARFFKRKALVLVAIIVVGAGVGYSIDSNFPKYTSQVIVASNFESIDYLYNTIELINSKIKERDVAFLKTVGIHDYENVQKISITPVIDVYDFISKNPQNFEMIKLLADGVDTKKTISDLVTSKNYSAHEISLITTNKDISKGIIITLLTYLNDNKFHEELRLTTIRNLDYQLKSNQEMIDQIDGILKVFSKEKEDKRTSEKLVYYNDNMQLNEIISTRNALVVEQGKLRIQKQYFNQFIKEKSTTLNIKDNKSITSKMRVIFPFLGLVIFLLLSLVVALSKKVEE